MRGIESQEYWSLSAAVTAFSGMAFAFVLCWWYFDVAQSAATRHVRTKQQAVRFQIWHYAHLPMFLGIGVAGIGIEHLITLRSGEQLSGKEVWILCSAVAVLTAALVSIGATSDAARTHGSARYLWGQFGLIGIPVFFGIVAPVLHRVVLVSALLATCCGQTLLGRATGLAPKLISRKAS
jgi:low temperature requirement protein LtrA